MLFSNSGLTLATHYCLGEARESAMGMGEIHLSCGMMDMEPEAEAHCCDNEISHLHGEEEVQTSSFSVQFIAAFFLLPSFDWSVLFSLQSLTTNFRLLSDAPPLPSPDIYLLVSNFRI